MKTKHGLLISAAVATLVVFMGQAFAQKYEANVYAGGFFPTTNDTVGRFRNEGLYGLRGGYFVNQNFEIGFNMGYINHFDLKSNNPLYFGLRDLGFSRPPIRAGIWDVTGDYNFGRRSLFGLKVEPILGFGVGLVDMDVRAIANPTAADLLLSPNSVCTSTSLEAGCSSYGAVIVAGGGSIIAQAPAGTFVGGNPSGFPANQKTVVASDNLFLSLSYGGGIRAARLWGPLGVRADLRGRTLPDFFGGQMTWPEVTAGITFGWGER